jgi:hypothetical protein
MRMHIRRIPVWYSASIWEKPPYPGQRHISESRV